jgi:predicted outer membrane protein
MRTSDRPTMEVLEFCLSMNRKAYILRVAFWIVMLLGLVASVAFARRPDSTKTPPDTLKISVKAELQNIEAAQKNIEDQYRALENIKAYLKAKQSAADTVKRK